MPITPKGLAAGLEALYDRGLAAGIKQEREAQSERVCGNCKNWTIYGERVKACAKIARTLGLQAFDVDDIETAPDFGCNRFEAKD